MGPRVAIYTVYVGVGIRVTGWFAHLEPFDTVRGLFVEGERAYPGGGFFSKTHTQIAVRSDHCIRGVFVPR